MKRYLRLLKKFAAFLTELLKTAALTKLSEFTQEIKTGDRLILEIGSFWKNLDMFSNWLIISTATKRDITFK